MRRTHRMLLPLALMLSLLLGGCGGSTSPEETVRDAEVPAAEYTQAGGDFEPYEAPPFQDSSFHASAAETGDGVSLDLSAVSDGYVAVSAESDARLKFQVKKDEDTWNYDIASDGTPSVFPLTGGNGEYLFRVMENISESKYAELFASECSVTMADPFGPFLRPSDYVPYAEDSTCVKKARELAKNVPDEVALVAAVYEYVCDTVTYDRDKAESVQSGYLPDPDETMATGKGICFDYAALAASMLRSQGIPTKMIFGYVSPDDLYHAWNMFYTEKTGWVTVSFAVSEDSWNRLDLTFAANGADDAFIGDGGNYADLYCY